MNQTDALERMGFGVTRLPVAADGTLSQNGAVVSVTGKVIKMRTETVCIHGDTHGAVDIARGVRQALNAAGIDVAPFKKAN